MIHSICKLARAFKKPTLLASHFLRCILVTVLMSHEPRLKFKLQFQCSALPVLRPSRQLHSRKAVAPLPHPPRKYLDCTHHLTPRSILRCSMSTLHSCHLFAFPPSYPCHCLGYLFPFAYTSAHCQMQDFCFRGFLGSQFLQISVEITFLLPGDIILTILRLV